MFKITGKDRWVIMIKSFAVTNNLNERLDLVLNDPWDSGIVVKSVEGLGPGKVTIHMKEVANGDGGSYGGARTPIRNIVLNLAFVGSPSIEDSRLLTYRFFPVKKQVTLTVLTDNNEVSIDGYVESNEPDIFSNLEGCQISILCADPYFYTERDQITTSSGIFPMLEFPVDNELIEDPETEKRIPSDEPYYDYTDTIVGKLPDNDVKLSPFTFDHYRRYGANNNYFETVTIENAIADDLSGTLPFNVTYEENGQTLTTSSGLFQLKMPVKMDRFDDEKKYSLSFLVDGEVDPSYVSNGSEFTLELYVYGGWFLDKVLANKKIARVDNRLYSANFTTKNLRVDIPLTKEIIDAIYDPKPFEGIYYRNPLEILAKGTYGGGLADNEPFAINGYSILIHNVVIYENDVKKQPGFSDEISYIYKWGTYRFTLTKRNPNNPHYGGDVGGGWSLHLDVIKEKMEWVNRNDSWEPKPRDGKRIFIFEMDIDFYIKRNEESLGGHDYVSLSITNSSMNINEELILCEFSGNSEDDESFRDTITEYKIEISEADYYQLLNDPNPILSFRAHYRVDRINPDNYGERYGYALFTDEVGISDISFYEVLQPTTDQLVLNKLNYLIDEGMPDYAFTKDGKKYNMRASEGIIMGEIQKYGFTHLIRYEGNASIGFQITISFVHSLALFDDNGLVGNPGYIVITSNYYPRKKMVIDLTKVWEIIQSVGENDGQVIPITEPGDEIFIDTRKKKKSIRYQKPYDYTYTNSEGESIVWDHAGYKINVLAASNRDIEWFELHQGDNELKIAHKSDPDMEREEDLENDHSEYLEVEVRNKVYYEGV